MQATEAIIACRSFAQAQDWSLVLISQGIESVISQQDEAGPWVLQVNEQELPLAREAIRAYEHENRRRWQREVKWAGLWFDARAGLWFLALALFHFLASYGQRDFSIPGRVDRAAVLNGEWWRVVTAVTLHADIAHLLANVTIGFVFLGLAMGCYGVAAALVLSLLGGALGNVISLSLHSSPFYSVGASGFVMASLGLLAAHSLSYWRNERRMAALGRGVIAGLLLMILLGLSPKSDVLAHFGGFLSGLLLGALALKAPKWTQTPWCKWGALVVFLTLILLSWFMALR